jgi:hypothetical protein
MKEWRCSGCGKPIEVYDEYEPEFCCDGRWFCECLGEVLNPMFCDECEVKIHGERP